MTKNHCLQCCQKGVRVIAASLFVVLLMVGCGSKITPDTLYGVWKGEAGSRGPTLITFIAKDRVEVQFYKAKDSKVRSGKWRIVGDEVVAIIDGLPKMTFSLDSIVMEDSFEHERLTDKANDIVVVKI